MGGCLDGGVLPARGPGTKEGHEDLSSHGQERNSRDDQVSGAVPPQEVSAQVGSSLSIILK